MIENISQKIDFVALKSAATNLRIPSKILEISSQEELVASLANEEISRDVHNLLFQIHVIEGYLVCPVSGRRFPVKDGIPNMLLHEDEV
jgi:multifunctional methyltransferase subunit TRM112